MKECLQAVWRGHQKEVSFRVESHKGNIRWLEAKAIPLFDEEKIVSSILLICNDLTDKIETEEKLKKSESNLSSILESVHDSIWSVDNNLILEYFNDGFAKLHKEQFGIKVKAGMSLEELMPESKFSNQQLKWKEKL
ncbi:MAG: PAS domain-containing protein [Bacteroidetes bacterium]|nr:PAS domain-containing protein [Bacteroidota bacterium]